MTAIGQTHESARPTIGLAQGVALYVCAILGAGVLVLPGQAASLAGPASILAWVVSALVGVPLAFTFAGLASRYPDSGGVATFARLAFGPAAGAVCGWWYFIAGSVGQTIVPLTAGYYVADASGISQRWAPLIACAVLLTAVVANLGGMRVSARFQMGLALAVGLILVCVVTVSATQLRAAGFTPFAPHGIDGIGRAVVVLFFAFAGWEAITHLSSEFRDVGRTLPRATALTLVIVTVLYVSLAVAVVGSGAYGDPHRDRVSLGLITQRGLGASAGAFVAVAAVVICLGTTNAFVASVSRLGEALARERIAPRALARWNRHGAPHVSVLTVGAIGGAGLVGAAIVGWGTDDIVYIPSVLVLATYLLGAGAGVRLLSGRGRLAARIALAALVCAAPFAGFHLVVPVVIAAIVLAHHHFHRGAAW